MSDETQTSTGEDADFREILKEIKAEHLPADALFENSVFKRKISSICRALTPNYAEAEDLAGTVCCKVFDKFHLFKPDYDLAYGNFFPWARMIARNARSDSRRKALIFGEIRSDELVTVADETTSVVKTVEVEDAVKRFLALVAALESKEQKIVNIWIDGIANEDGFSLREIEARLLEDGIECSHVTVGKVVARVIRTFIDNEEALSTVSVIRKGEQTSSLHEKGDLTYKDEDIPFKRKTGS